MLSIAMNLCHIGNFDNQSQASEFISTMSFGFEWQLLDNNNQVIATHFYE